CWIAPAEDWHAGRAGAGLRQQPADVAVESRPTDLRWPRNARFASDRDQFATSHQVAHRAKRGHSAPFGVTCFWPLTGSTAISMPRRTCLGLLPSLAAVTVAGTPAGAQQTQKPN